MSNIIVNFVICSNIIYTIVNFILCTSIITILQRDVYRNFLRNTDAVIYVVDEKEYMIPAVKEDLHGIFQDEWLEGVPLLIVANKKDLHPENFTELLKDKLDLNEMKGCDWRKYLENVSTPP